MLDILTGTLQKEIEYTGSEYTENDFKKMLTKRTAIIKKRQNTLTVSLQKEVEYTDTDPSERGCIYFQ
jgi:hypothetical protein